MKWMEMIRMRSSAEAIDTGMRIMREFLEQISGQAGLSRFVVIRHAYYPGEAGAILVWNDSRVPERTREGLALAELISDHGVVEHAVWEFAAIYPELSDTAPSRTQD